MNDKQIDLNELTNSVDNEFYKEIEKLSFLDIVVSR